MTKSNTDVDATSTAGEPAGAANRSLPIAKIAIGLAAIVALVVLGRGAGGYVQLFAQWVESVGIFGPVVFILGYAAAVVAFVPASLLTLARVPSSASAREHWTASRSDSRFPTCSAVRNSVSRCPILSQGVATVRESGHAGPSPRR